MPGIAPLDPELEHARTLAVPLLKAGDIIGTIAKYVRLMGQAGVSFRNLVRPNDDLVARENLARYLEAGCPALALVRVGSDPLGPDREARIGATWIYSYQMTRRMTLGEMAAAVLGVPKDTSHDSMVTQLRRARYTLTRAEAKAFADVTFTRIGDIPEPKVIHVPMMFVERGRNDLRMEHHWATRGDRGHEEYSLGEKNLWSPHHRLSIRGVHEADRHTF